MDGNVQKYYTYPQEKMLQESLQVHERKREP